MTKATFTDNSTITVISKDGEIFTLKPHLPVPAEKHQEISQAIAHSFEKNFEDDKTSMVYWVLIDMMTNFGFGFSFGSSDREEERIRIGSRIKELREKKGIEAKQLALLANIDPANLSRIENGRYSIGLDILVRIGDALGTKVDLVPVILEK